MKSRTGVRIMSMLMLLSALTASQAYETGDAQMWLTVGASGKFTNNLAVAVNEQLRWGDDASELYYTETALQLAWDAREWLTLGAVYTEAYDLKTKTLYDASGKAVLDNYWADEHQPAAEATFKGKAKGWKMDDRVRVEYRMKEDTQDYFRYRNRVRFISPWKWTALKINPRAYYEVNLSDMPAGVDWVFDRQRVYVGATLSLVDRVNGELYYLKQFDWTSGDWREYNVFGIGITASF